MAPKGYSDLDLGEADEMQMLRLRMLAIDETDDAADDDDADDTDADSPPDAGE